MKITLFFFSLLFVTNALSQKVEVEFGRVSPEEMEMTIYEKDKEAKAVILYDKGESIFFDTPKGGYDIRFTRHKRIKIFDKSESQPAEISIPFYVDGFGKTEKVVSIEAFTFNTENGRIFRKTLDPSTIYEERINKRWLRKKFVFPDVQDGSILELKYVLETPFHFNLPDWKFQDKIPTIYSEYEVRMIPFYEYVFLLQGVTKFDYRNSFVTKEKRYWGRGVEFQEYVHVYGLKDIPAFKDESYITSINDHIVKLDFQLAKFNSPRGGNREIISTWPALNQALLKHERFGKYLKNSERLAEKILEEELDLLALKPDKKVSKIIDYVKNSFEWNGSYSKYGSQSPKDFLNKKSGSVADINLFLTAMLNAAGINAQPVILSTRNHGKIYTDYPFDHYTNYVITLVSSSSPFLADATEDFLPFNRLPPRCLNGKGLIVNSDEEVSWVNLGSSIPSSNKKLITLTIDSLSLNVDAKVLVQSTEYESYYSRKKFSDDKTKLEAFYSDKIGNISETKNKWLYQGVNALFCSV